MPFHTPNTERLWNERLKAMEDVLKPHTLWRAPHTQATVGLPPLHLDLNHLVNDDESMRWVALPRSISDHLVCRPERLPSLATLMRMERQWAQQNPLDEGGRKAQTSLDTISYRLRWPSITSMVYTNWWDFFRCAIKERSRIIRPTELYEPSTYRGAARQQKPSAQLHSSSYCTVHLSTVFISILNVALSTNPIGPSAPISPVTASSLPRATTADRRPP